MFIPSHSPPPSPFSQEPLPSYENLITESPALPMSDSRFGHEVASPFIKNTTLEGASIPESTGWFEDNWDSIKEVSGHFNKSNGYDFDHTCGLEGLKLGSTRDLLAEEDKRNQVFIGSIGSAANTKKMVDRLKPGSFLVLRLGVSKHAVNLVIQKEESDQLKMTLVNTGLGLRYHPVKKHKVGNRNKNLFQATQSFIDIDPSKINTETFWGVVGSNELKIEGLYALCHNYLGKHGKKLCIPINQEERFTSPQQAGNCTVQSLFATVEYIALERAPSLSQGRANSKRYALFYKMRSTILKARSYAEEKEFNRSTHALISKSLPGLHRRLKKAKVNGHIDERCYNELRETLRNIKRQLKATKKAHSYQYASWSRDFTQLKERKGFATIKVTEDKGKEAEKKELQKSPISEVTFPSWESLPGVNLGEKLQFFNSNIESYPVSASVDYIITEVPNSIGEGLSDEQKVALFTTLTETHTAISAQFSEVDLRNREGRIRARRLLLAMTKLETLMHEVSKDVDALKSVEAAAAYFQSSPSMLMGMFNERFNLKEQQVLSELNFYHENCIQKTELKYIHSVKFSNKEIIPTEEDMHKIQAYYFGKAGEPRGKGLDSSIENYEENLEREGNSEESKQYLKKNIESLKKLKEEETEEKPFLFHGLNYLKRLQEKAAIAADLVKKMESDTPHGKVSLSQYKERKHGERPVPYTKKRFHCCGISQKSEGNLKCLLKEYLKILPKGPLPLLKPLLIESLPNSAEAPSFEGIYSILEEVDCKSALRDLSIYNRTHEKVYCEENLLSHEAAEERAFTLLHHLRQLPLPQSDFWKTIIKESDSRKITCLIDFIRGHLYHNVISQLPNYDKHTITSLQSSLFLSLIHLEFIHFDLLRRNDPDQELSSHWLNIPELHLLPYTGLGWGTPEDRKLFRQLQTYMREQELNYETGIDFLSKKELKKELGNNTSKSFGAMIGEKRLQKLYSSKTLRELQEKAGLAPSETALIQEEVYEGKNPHSLNTHLHAAESAGTENSLLLLQRLLNSTNKSFHQLNHESLSTLIKKVMSNPYLDKQLKSNPQLLGKLIEQTGKVRVNLKERAEHALFFDFLHLEALLCSFKSNQESSEKISALIQEALSYQRQSDNPNEFCQGPLYAMILLQDKPLEAWTSQDKIQFLAYFNAYTYLSGEQGQLFPQSLPSRLKVIRHALVQEGCLNEEGALKAFKKEVAIALSPYISDLYKAEEGKGKESCQQGVLSWDPFSGYLAVDGHIPNNEQRCARERLQEALKSKGLKLDKDSMDRATDARGRVYEIYQQQHTSLPEAATTEGLLSTCEIYVTIEGERYLQSFGRVPQAVEEAPLDVDGGSRLNADQAAQALLHYVSKKLDHPLTELSLLSPTQKKGPSYITYKGRRILTVPFSREEGYPLGEIARFSTTGPESKLYLGDWEAEVSSLGPKEAKKDTPLRDLLKQLGKGTVIWSDHNSQLKEINVPHLKLNFDVDQVTVESEGGQKIQERRLYVRGTDKFYLSPDQGIGLKQAFPDGLLLCNEEGEKKLLLLKKDSKELFLHFFPTKEKQAENYEPEFKKTLGYESLLDSSVKKNDQKEGDQPIVGNDHLLLDIQEAHGEEFFAPQSYSECLFLCMHFADRKKYKRLKETFEQLSMLSVPTERDKETLVLLFRMLAEQDSPESRPLALSVFAQCKRAQHLFPGQESLLREDDLKKAQETFYSYVEKQKASIELDLSRRDSELIELYLNPPGDLAKETASIVPIPVKDLEGYIDFNLHNYGLKEMGIVAETSTEEALQILQEEGEEILKSWSQNKPSVVRESLISNSSILAVALACEKNADLKPQLADICLLYRSMTPEYKGKESASTLANASLDYLMRITLMRTTWSGKVVTPLFREYFPHYQNTEDGATETKILFEKASKSLIRSIDARKNPYPSRSREVTEKEQISEKQIPIEVVSLPPIYPYKAVKKAPADPQASKKESDDDLPIISGGSSSQGSASEPTAHSHQDEIKGMISKFKENEGARETTIELVTNSKNTAQKAANEQRTKILNMIQNLSSEAEAELEALDKGKLKPTFSRLLDAWRTQNKQRYRQILYLKDEEISELDNLISDYLRLSAQAQDWERLEKVLQSGSKQGFTPSFFDKLESNFSGCPHYPLVDTISSRLYLYTEVALKIRLRKTQVEFMDRFFSHCIQDNLDVEALEKLMLDGVLDEKSFDEVKKGSKEHRLIDQLGTGSGKSKVLAPLMQEALKILKERGILPESLTGAIWPNKLYEGNALFSDLRTQSTFRHGSQVFYITREMDLGNKELIGTLLREVKSCVREGVTFHIHPSSIKSLHLKHLLYLKELSKINKKIKAKEQELSLIDWAINSDKEQELERLKEKASTLSETIKNVSLLQAYFREGNLLDDESQISQDPLSAHLQFALGKKVSLSNENCSLLGQFFKLLTRKPLAELLDIANNQQKKKLSLGLDYDEDVAKGILIPQLVNGWLSKTLRLDDNIELSDEQKEQLKKYLTNAAAKDLGDFGDLKKRLSQDSRELIYLTRGLIHKILPSALSKEVNLHFAIVEGTDKESIAATPYRAANDPNIGSEFENILFTACASGLSLIHQGLNPTQTELLAQYFLNRIGDLDVQSTSASIRESVESCFGKGFSHESLKRVAEGIDPAPELDSGQKSARAVTFLRKFGFQSLKYFESKVAASPQTEAYLTTPSKVHYSATPGHERCYGPETKVLAHLDKKGLKEAKGTFREKAYISSVEFKGAENTVDLLADSLLNSPNSYMLVDAGALLKSIKSQAFAQNIAYRLKDDETLRPDITAVEFFVGDRTYVIKRSDPATLIPSELCKTPYKERLRYCDHAHLTGADFTLPEGATGTLTASLNTGADDLIQGAGRYRNLKYEEAGISVIIEKAYAQKISTEQGLLPEEAISPEHLLKYCKGVQEHITAQKLALSLCQRADLLIRKQLIDATVPTRPLVDEVPEVEQQLEAFERFESATITSSLPDFEQNYGGSFVYEDYKEKVLSYLAQVEAQLDELGIDEKDALEAIREEAKNLKELEEKISHSISSEGEGVAESYQEKKQESESSKEVAVAPCKQERIEDTSWDIDLLTESYLPGQKTNQSAEALERKKTLYARIKVEDKLKLAIVPLKYIYERFIKTPLEKYRFYDIREDTRNAEKYKSELCRNVALIALSIGALAFSVFALYIGVQSGSKKVLSCVKILKNFSKLFFLYFFIATPALFLERKKTKKINYIKVSPLLFNPHEKPSFVERINNFFHNRKPISHQMTYQKSFDSLAALSSNNKAKGSFQLARIELGKAYTGSVNRFFHPPSDSPSSDPQLSFHSHVSRNVWRQMGDREPDDYTGPFAQQQPGYEHFLVIRENQGEKERVDTVMGSASDLRHWRKALRKGGKKVETQRRIEIWNTQYGCIGRCAQSESEGELGEGLSRALEWERIKWKLFDGHFELSESELEIFESHLKDMDAEDVPKLRNFLIALLKLKKQQGHHRLAGAKPKSFEIFRLMSPQK